uniref:Midasin n=1 Tax=Romanomermis culicivorax TaxID=13658 RepID=A0A915IPR2_ROMCU
MELLDVKLPTSQEYKGLQIEIETHKLMDFCASYFNENLTSSISSRNSDLPAQLLLIVSDGRGIFGPGMEKVKSAVQKAISRQLFIVFVILDNPNNKDSIMDIKVPLFGKTGPPEIKSYLEFFPFAFYIVLRRINELPAILGDALRQWFEVLSTR